MGVLRRTLPTPSDRMGIIWALSGIKESIILEYGPSGTTHYSIQTASKMEANDDNLYCTHITEDDVVMGNTKSLEEAIIELDKEKNPKYIFVVGSSVTAIIAADLEGVAFYVKDKISAKIITYSHGCFVGDYSLGIRDVLNSFKNIVNKPTKKENMYNIIGAIGDSYRNSSDINAIEEIMEDTFDMKSLAIFPKTSITNMQNSSNAKINIVIRNEGLGLAKYMQEMYNIPYIYTQPYGYKGTKDWLIKIGEYLDKGPNKKIIDRINEKILECSIYKMYSRLYKITPVVKIFANYDVVDGIGKFLKDEIFFNEVGQYASHSLKYMTDINEKITSVTDEGEKIELLRGEKEIFVLADDETLNFADEKTTKLRVANPVIDWTAIATHMPFMTDKGADFIREYVEAYFKNIIRLR